MENGGTQLNNGLHELLLLLKTDDSKLELETKRERKIVLFIVYFVVIHSYFKIELNNIKGTF